MILRVPRQTRGQDIRFRGIRGPVIQQEDETRRRRGTEEDSSDDEHRWFEDVTQMVGSLSDHVLARLKTTGAGATVIKNIPIATGTTYGFSWMVAARQTAGSGTVGDGAVYTGQAAFHLVGGSATLIGSVVSLMAVEDNAAWAATVAGSGNLAQWTVTGEASKTIGWRIDIDVRQISL